jgi:hypothetical protein
MRVHRLPDANLTVLQDPSRHHVLGKLRIRCQCSSSNQQPHPSSTHNQQPQCTQACLCLKHRHICSCSSPCDALVQCPLSIPCCRLCSHMPKPIACASSAEAAHHTLKCALSSKVGVFVYRDV